MTLTNIHVLNGLDKLFYQWFDYLIYLIAESEDELWDAENAKIKKTTMLNNNRINFGGGLMVCI